jgi:type IV pilus assembly protein PilA
MKSISSRHIKSLSGFTLIELLVVIGILAVLLSITLIAINPAKQFAQANNTKRRSDVNAILNAINQYMADNKGSIPPTNITTTDQEISNTAANICSVLVPVYIAAFPVDPQTNNGNPISQSGCGGVYATNYHVVQSASSNRITVSAPGAELGDTIQVTR